ncbi:MAG: hypothetical protein J7L08_04265 [Candidatus Aenigmarchaeota archaeon]|nr:hypothetical protein [Candidatus Aenigmarchaeota archaeon]
MKIFLAGPFKEKEDEKLLESVYNLLTNNGYKVWWSPKEVEKGYDSNDIDLCSKIKKEEFEAIEDSDLLVAVMKKSTFGTSFEIQHSEDCKIPVIGYILEDHPDFSSGSFKATVKDIVKNDGELLEHVKRYKN